MWLLIGEHEPEVRFLAQEVSRQPYVSHHDCDERRDSGTGDTICVAGHPAENKKRRQHHVDDYRAGRDQHAWLEIADSAQCRRLRDQHELECHRRNEPEKVLSRERGRLRIGAHRAAERKSHQHSDNQKNNSYNDGQHLRLIEHQLRIVVALSSDRVRHGGRRADAEHLGQGKHDEGGVAGYCNGGDRVRAESANPVEVDQEIQRLEDHRHEHEARGLQQMPGERSGGKVFHRTANLAGA